MADIIDFEKLKKDKEKLQSDAKKAMNSGPDDELKELLGRTLEVLEAQDKVTGMLLHDVMVLAKKIEMIEVTNFNNAASTQVVVTLLTEKFNKEAGQTDLSITKEDFTKIWDRDIMPQLKELQEQQQQEENKTQDNGPKIIKPKSGIIKP